MITKANYAGARRSAGEGAADAPRAGCDMGIGPSLEQDYHLNNYLCKSHALGALCALVLNERYIAQRRTGHDLRVGSREMATISSDMQILGMSLPMHARAVQRQMTGGTQPRPRNQHSSAQRRSVTG
eukprot:4367011-Pleurochrysis_carterae.AAC.1